MPMRDQTAPSSNVIVGIGLVGPFVTMPESALLDSIDVTLIPTSYVSLFGLDIA